MQSVLPPDLVTMATLANAAWGAAAGLAIGLAGYIIRDWPVIRHRLEKRLMIARGHANAHDWPDEPEGYQPNTLTGRERADLVQTLAFMTIGGAVWMVAVSSDSQFLKFLALAGASILVVARQLASDDAEEVGADPDGQQGETRAGGRLAIIGWELAAILFFAVTVIDSVRERVADWVLHGPRVAVWGTAALAALLAAYALWCWWHSPERARTEVHLPKEAVIGFAGALVIVGSIIALAALM